ncbi:hypothetical protein M409DRAFT_66248 [Zasmidium cellare ATCC 36951]|uniref:Myb-like domain-containing protein n=1 Tax=Zasmidium cellare ATCC 36951 TaxID=1080233 RepID=A0A6A6CM44_ZASCE|nr:uncharacterized protein M409DRAFT_66248 [Zasmidium cellare ATCC 36951]KAF2167230.1 hypothetical protein M409DRAFT_66248 [Zasmidium cellare ATCC 36951]
MAKITGAPKAPTASAPATTTRRTRSQSAEPAATAPAPRTGVASRSRGGRNSRASSEEADDGPRRKNNNAAAPAVDLTTVDEDDDDEDAQLQAHIAQSQAAIVPPSQPIPADTRTAFDRRRISTGSAISGTTAKTSFSAEEIEEMDPDIMIDALPTLATAADEFAHFLAPDGSDTSPALWKDIRTTGTKLSKLYERRKTPFNFHKGSFGSQKYIQPRNVLRAFLGVHSTAEIPKAPWRPDPILLKANLAEMLNTVFVVCDSDQWTSTGSDALEGLHASLPDAIAGRDFDLATFSYYLDLTAQLTIRRMDVSIESEPNFSPHAVVDNLFYDDDETFRHMEELGLTTTSEENRNHALQLIDRLAEELKKPFRSRTGNGAAAANGKLKAKYQWDYLKMHTLKYYEARANQLTKRIAKAGGVAQISQALTEEVDRRKDMKVADEIRLIRQKPTSTPRTSLAGMAALKELDDSDYEDGSARAASQAESAGSAPRESEAQPDSDIQLELETQPEPELDLEPVPELEAEHESLFVPADEEEPPQQPEPEPEHEPQRLVDVVERDFAPISPAPRKTAAKSRLDQNFRMASSFHEKHQKRRQESSQKQRGRFIDPQPNAVFVEWNEDELSQQDDRRAEETQFRDPRISPPKGKRTRTQIEEDEEDEEENGNIPDPTQDEGFQTDNRDVSAANQRRKEVSFAGQTRPPPRYRSLDTDRSAAGPSNYRSTAPEPEPRPSPAKRQRLNPGSSTVPFNEPLPTGTDLPVNELYARAKIYARQNSAVSSAPRQLQTRRPWSGEEEAALMELIEKHGGDGVSYANLKNLDAALKDDAKLTSRSAEDLRWKARNMKVTLLLGFGSQEQLPANWEWVMLDKKAMDKLRSRGVAYTQDRQRGVMYA